MWSMHTTAFSSTWQDCTCVATALVSAVDMSGIIDYRDLNGGADAAHMDKEDGDRRYFISQRTDGRTDERPAGRGGHSKRTPSLRDLSRPGPRFWRVPLERSPGPDRATDSGAGFPDRDRSAGGRSI